MGTFRGWREANANKHVMRSFVLAIYAAIVRQSEIKYIGTTCRMSNILLAANFLHFLLPEFPKH